MLCRMALIRTNMSEEHRFLQEPHNVTFQKMAFFIVTTMKTSNLTILSIVAHKHIVIRTYLSSHYLTVDIFQLCHDIALQNFVLEKIIV
jgi:S-adenosylmethionine/arginine decarboxylase-like enzyme